MSDTIGTEVPDELTTHAPIAVEVAKPSVEGDLSGQEVPVEYQTENKYNKPESAFTTNQAGLAFAAPAASSAIAAQKAKMAYNFLDKKFATHPGIQNYIDSQIGSDFNLTAKELSKLTGMPVETQSQAQQAIAKISAQPGVDLSGYKKSPKYYFKKHGELPLRLGVAGYDIGRGLHDDFTVGSAADLAAGTAMAASPFLKGKLKTAATVAGALPIVGGLISGASAEPLRPEQAASGAVDIGTSLLRGPLGMMVSPTELGDATVQPKNEAYYPGMHVLQGSTLPPGHAEGGNIKKLVGGAAKLAGPLTLGALSIPQIAEAREQLKRGHVGEAAGTAADIGSMFLPNPLMALYMGLSPSELGSGTLYGPKEMYQEGDTGLLKGSSLPRYAPGGSVAKKVLEEAKPLFEKFKYDRYKIAQDYPEVIPPVLTTDSKTGKEFLQKQLGPDALEVQKARKEAQKQINAGNYEPFFDINQRYYADPSHYPTAGYTQTDIVPKKAETIAKYTELANDPESLARLRGAFEKAKDRPAAKDWYAMGQLEDAFIKELGPEEGRKQFKNRFADAMAATTGGADPNSNLMMAAYTNYQKALGREIPTKAADLPFPIGGRFVSGNMEQAKKLADVGEIPVTNPKRHNFSANFLGHRDVSTLDEQMSQLWDPKMMSPPPNAYGIYQAALAKEAEKAGVQPANFQDIAWAGAKDYPGKPMMQEINEMLGRTHLITGEPQEEILKGFIRGDKPMYGIGAAGVGAAVQDEDMPHMAPGGSIIKGALSLFKGKANNLASKYHPLVQKGLDEGRIHPNDAQWMSDYANTPGRAEVETGSGAFKDQSERMQNFVGRMERGEIEIPKHMQGPGGVSFGGNSSELNPSIDQ